MYYRSPSGGYIQMTITAGLSGIGISRGKSQRIQVFFPYACAEIAPYSTAKSANGKQTTVLRFRASTNKLRPLYNLLYPAGERQITQPVLDILEPRPPPGAGPRALGSEDVVEPNFHGLGIHEQAMRLNNWFELLTVREVK